MLSFLHNVAAILKQSDVCGPGALQCTDNIGPSTIQTALQIAFGIAGAIAVIIIIIAGLRYTISSGNPQEAAKAKNAILYAVVGLVVCGFFQVMTNHSY